MQTHSHHRVRILGRCRSPTLATEIQIFEDGILIANHPVLEGSNLRRVVPRPWFLRQVRILAADTLVRHSISRTVERRCDPGKRRLSISRLQIMAGLKPVS